MKLLLLLLAVVLTAPPPASAQTDASKEIRVLLTEQVGAWNRGDIESFMTAYWKSPGLTFSGTDGVTRGWETVLARYKKRYPDRAAMGTLAFSDLEITLLARDAALVLGRWQLKRDKDSPDGAFTLVLRRFSEGWRIIHDHTSSGRAPQPNTGD